MSDEANLEQAHADLQRHTAQALATAARWVTPADLGLPTDTPLTADLLPRIVEHLGTAGERHSLHAQATILAVSQAAAQTETELRARLAEATTAAP